MRGLLHKKAAGNRRLLPGGFGCAKLDDEKGFFSAALDWLFGLVGYMAQETAGKS